MSLYVRVFNSFYSHRKTARLKAALGNDALWIPPRLWAICAEHQPDGDLSDYSAEEIASLIGYTGNAASMLEALLKAGFLDRDPLRVHNWSTHNSYHAIFAGRARNAANARWKGKERKGKETSNASSMQKASGTGNL